MYIKIVPFLVESFEKKNDIVGPFEILCMKFICNIIFKLQCYFSFITLLGMDFLFYLSSNSSFISNL